MQGTDENNSKKKHVPIQESGINMIDLAGGEMLKHEAMRRQSMGGGLYFRRLKERAVEFLDHGGYLSVIGKNNLFPAEKNAIEEIYPRLDSEICGNGEKRSDV